MKRAVCIPFILCIGLLSYSCEQKGGDGAQSGDIAQGGVSASVVPQTPTAKTPLTVSVSGMDAVRDTVYTFRWFVDGRIVQEGPNGNLSPGTYVRGSSVYVEVIPSDRTSSRGPYKTEAVTVLNLPPEISAISISPERPAVDDSITAVPSISDPDGDSVSVRYQWFVNGRAVTEPNEKNEFTARGLRKKDMLNVVITVADGESAGEPKTSDIMALVNSPPRITSKPPDEFQKGVYRYQVTAQDPDGDALKYSLAKSPSGMTIDPSTGLITWEPKPVAAREEVVVKIVVSDGDGGSMDQEYSFNLEP